MKTQTLQIKGFSFQIPEPYHEGYTLSVTEATVLNNLYAERIRNSWSKAVDNAKEAGILPEGHGQIQEALNKYTQDYSFSPRGPRVSVDPVMREAQKIAKGMVLATLANNKIDPKGLPEGKLDSMIERAIQIRPDIMKEAQSRIASKNSLAENVLQDLMEEVDAPGE